MSICDAFFPIQVACGLNHTLFLTAAGRVFADGWSSDGQTGQSGFVYSDRPVNLVCVQNLASCT